MYTRHNTYIRILKIIIQVNGAGHIAPGHRDSPAAVYPGDGPGSSPDAVHPAIV